MDPKILSLINSVVLLVFVILVVLAVLRLGLRYIEYKRLGLKVPALLPRDFFLFVGLGVPFLGVLVFRTFGIIPSETWWYPIWILGSEAFGIAGVAYWVYYEYFKIGKVK